MDNRPGTQGIILSALFGSSLSLCSARNRRWQNLAETILTHSNVHSNTFGKLFTISVDGVIDAQPLYLSSISIPGQGTHNVLYVVTENDSVYAFDPDTGTELWHVSLLASGETPSDTRNCSQITPEIGITSTPVIDRSSGRKGNDLCGGDDQEFVRELLPTLARP